jgi:hypothetical protein
MLERRAVKVACAVLRGGKCRKAPTYPKPVGTGVVESACGAVVKHRMEGEGKRWSLAGAEAMLALRSLKKSHDNDLRAYWRFRARQERDRLYARKPKYRPTPRLRRVA